MHDCVSNGIFIQVRLDGPTWTTLDFDGLTQSYTKKRSRIYVFTAEGLPKKLQIPNVLVLLGWGLYASSYILMMGDSFFTRFSVPQNKCWAPLKINNLFYRNLSDSNKKRQNTARALGFNEATRNIVHFRSFTKLYWNSWRVHIFNNSNNKKKSTSFKLQFNNNVMKEIYWHLCFLMEARAKVEHCFSQHVLQQAKNGNKWRFEL